MKPECYNGSCVTGFFLPLKNENNLSYARWACAILPVSQVTSRSIPFRWQSLPGCWLLTLTALKAFLPNPERICSEKRLMNGQAERVRGRCRTAGAW